MEWYEIIEKNYLMIVFINKRLNTYMHIFI